MKTFFKKVFLVGIISLSGYFFIRIYIKINAAIKLNKNIPEYLKNIYGEDTKVEIKIACRNNTIVIKCSEELQKKSEIVKETVLNYIEDFYPEFTSSNLSIVIEAEPEEIEDTI
jgi:hypothetical protein